MSIVIDGKKITDINISNKNVQKIVDILTNKIIFEKTKPVSNEYFYIENTYNGSNTISLKTTIGSGNITGSHATQLQYSKDKETWETITLNGTNTISMLSGERVYFRNDSGSFNWYSNPINNFYTQINCSNNHKVGGNINSLLDYNNYNVAITPYCFYELFYKNEYLTDANELIFSKTSLASNCYREMFYRCTSLTTAPIELPATTLAGSCYREMFYGCTSLNTAPKLPATNLEGSCYYSMFDGCTSLTTAPTLPATTLADYCYEYMFYGCTSLTTAPSLPATMLKYSCYRAMFQGCTSLTVAPALPATTITDYCYAYMFQDCTSLTTAPTELPATTLERYCYNFMFYRCTSLTTAPKLPATTLANYCYTSMFRDCTSLTVVSTELPATTLADYCYQSMFNGCSKLTSVPALPATTLTNYCYRGIFENCASLNSITVYADDVSATDCTYSWLSGVANSGTFRNLGSATYSRDASGIPTGWTEVKN